MIKMSDLFFMALILVSGSAIFLIRLNFRKESEASLAGPDVAPRSDTLFKTSKKGDNLTVVFLANAVFYCIQFFLPRFAMGFFGTQVMLNLLAAVYCSLSGRPELARTFLLCLLWVCLIGPAIIATVGIVIFWAVCGH